jgi:hypothetical protein
MRPFSFLVLFASLAACSGPATPPGGRVSGLGLMRSLAGLWTGSATMTLLGDFAMMNLDFRGASDHMLFGRVDLDAENSLRLAFDVETLDGHDVLVFRNGGLFSGLSRDTRTVLVDSDEGAGVYHFCARAAEGGCRYTDAVFTFDGDDHVVLEVHVREAPHLLWDARRAETRELPTPFPATETSTGDGTAPFPPMPALHATIRWSTALAEPADVWLLLATSPCIDGTCVPSRWFHATAGAGTSSIDVVLDQIHAGDYLGTAILDRDGSLAETLVPGRGDAVSVPDAALTIDETGVTTTTLSVLVEL